MKFPIFGAPRTAKTDAEIDHLRDAVATCSIRDFAVPHIVVDNIFTEKLVEQINEHWPSGHVFAQEIPGNHNSIYADATHGD